MGDDDRKSGFSALTSLASATDEVDVGPKERSRANASPGSDRGSKDPENTEQEVRENGTSSSSDSAGLEENTWSSGPRKQPSGSRGWVWFVVAAVGILWILNVAEDGTQSPTKTRPIGMSASDTSPRPTQPETPEFTKPPAGTNRTLTMDIQNALAQLGYDPGAADGIYGRKTKAAIEAFQHGYGMNIDGRESQDLLRDLRRAIDQEPKPFSSGDGASSEPFRREALSQRGFSKEKIEVLGQWITFSNPTGYCTLGTSPSEQELLILTRRSLGDDVRLLHAAVLCTELDDYKNGRRDMLDHWLQIQLIGPGGDFKRIETSREALLEAVSTSIPRVNAEEINRRLRSSFEGSHISLSQPQLNPLGRDGNAVYFSMRMNMTVESSIRVITGMSGITLLNSLPITINVYEGTGLSRSRENLQPVLQELLTSLLTEN